MTTPAKPKIDPRVFERAARDDSLANGVAACCPAIAANCDTVRQIDAHKLFFAKIFCPPEVFRFNYWWDIPMSGGPRTILARQIALLLTAQIARSEFI
jgi:hypothetical protein